MRKVILTVLWIMFLTAVIMSILKTYEYANVKMTLSERSLTTWRENVFVIIIGILLQVSVSWKKENKEEGDE